MRQCPARSGAFLDEAIRSPSRLSRHTRLQTVISEAVAYGELTFAGVQPETGPAADESAALIAELRGGGWLA